MPPRSGKVVIIDADRPTPLSEGGMRLAADMDVHALVGNTGTIFIGDSSARLSSEIGSPLSAGDSYHITAGDDLADWFISGAAGNGVSFNGTI